MLYIIAPNTPTGKLIRKPFMKFLIHASSYLFFLCKYFHMKCLFHSSIFKTMCRKDTKRSIKDDITVQPKNWNMLQKVLRRLFLH
jgi:transient-receptor-potential-like protein